MEGAPRQAKKFRRIGCADARQGLRSEIWKPVDPPSTGFQPPPDDAPPLRRSGDSPPERRGQRLRHPNSAAEALCRAPPDQHLRWATPTLGPNGLLFPKRWHHARDAREKPRTLATSLLVSREGRGMTGICSPRMRADATRPPPAPGTAPLRPARDDHRAQALVQCGHLARTQPAKTSS